MTKTGGNYENDTSIFRPSDSLSLPTMVLFHGFLCINPFRKNIRNVSDGSFRGISRSSSKHSYRKSSRNLPEIYWENPFRGFSSMFWITCTVPYLIFFLSLIFLRAQRARGISSDIRLSVILDIRPVIAHKVTSEIATRMFVQEFHWNIFKNLL